MRSTASRSRTGARRERGATASDPRAPSAHDLYLKTSVQPIRNGRGGNHKHVTRPIWSARCARPRSSSAHPRHTRTHRHPDPLRQGQGRPSLHLRVTLGGALNPETTSRAAARQKEPSARGTQQPRITHQESFRSRHPCAFAPLLPLCQKPHGNRPIRLTCPAIVTPTPRTRTKHHLLLPYAARATTRGPSLCHIR